MKLKTASEVINFAKEVEEKSAELYESLAKIYSQYGDVFLSFFKENNKNKLWVQRVYQEVVSDALETGFSFEGLDTDNYLIEVNLSEDESLSEVLKKILKMEEKIQKFYIDAAEKSKSLLADVPRIFERIVKRREKRKLEIKNLQEVRL